MQDDKSAHDKNTARRPAACPRDDVLVRNDKTLSSNHYIRRQQIRNALIVFFVIILLVAIGTLCSHDEQATKLTTAAQNTFTPIALGSNHVDDSAVWLHRAENTLMQERKDTDDIKTQLDKMNAQNALQVSEEKTAIDKINALEQKIHVLETQVNAQQLAYPGLNQPPHASDGTPLPPLPSARTVPAFNNAPSFATAIKSDTLTSDKRATDTTTPPKKSPKNYVPAGTFVHAMLLSGLDASAGVTSQSEPRPVILRLLNHGTLPNHRHSHLKNCFVTGAGFGDISSERVYIRLERLSCTRAHQRILDIPVYGYVSGPDGKAGVRGTAVWRESALLQRSFIGGLFSGLGQGVSGMTTSPLQAETALNPHAVVQGGLASGTGNALSKFADYNIRRAEQYQPIIEVSATTVTVVFHTGFYLNDDKANDAASTALTASSTPPLSSSEKEDNTHA